ncbi:MSC_0882 family membrane protein [Spiroplasma diminutum]|uniref:Transmembrane protein n=1 Tax=Spiroplasma diminutum CUAS-1 TaxID=1276221 RepID=S5MJ61_9MOLU|nr:hypothetical protein [Spiroplasma diminutum]AGR41995.1 hypothetical protein SDIMI_v3c02910 [Spiroplasma diminutum CUAS-1]
MSGLFNPFKKENLTENQNQQNVGDFALNQNPQQMINYQNETAMYQKNLIESKNEGYIRPRNRNFENSYYEQAQNIPQYTRSENNRDMNLYPQNNQINYQQQFVNQIPPQVQQQRMIQQQPANFNNYPQQYENLKQEYLDFDNSSRIDYGNYRDENQYNRMVYPPNNNVQGIRQNEIHNNKPLYENYQMPNNNMQYGYNDFSNNNQFYSQNNQYGYNPEIDYAPVSSNNYNAYDQNSYQQRMKNANIVPKEIGKEIRSEKLRIFIVFLIGTVGIISASFMLAIYYKSGADGTFLGMTRDKVMYPFFSIILLIVSTGFFLTSLTDFGFLYSNVKKYERDLLFGKELVPYFITRNYRSLISRSIYLNWIAFCVYIFGAISLAIMYGMDSKKGTDVYFFFWKIGQLKSLESEIKTNVVVLFVTLIVHVLNIVTTRTRKNNIIGYYGYEIIPQHEIKEIKKKANKVCMIIFFTTMAIILFLIVIPWLIIRKKRGLPLKPWGTVN